LSIVWETTVLLLPEVVLSMAACVAMLGATFSVAPRIWPVFTLLSIAVAAVCLLVGDLSVPTAANVSAIAIDDLSQSIRWFTVLLAAGLTLAAASSQSESDTSGEFHGLLLLAVVGTMLAASANDLITLFLSLELLSVPTYVLLYLGRRDYASQESAVKYFLLSVLSSALLMYGFGLVYCLTGSTNLTVVRTVLVAAAPGGAIGTGLAPVGIAALLLVFAGLGFKLAAVPFHFYAPDVYEGTTNFNAAVLSIAPKAAGLIALIRVANVALTGYEAPAMIIALIVSAATMTLGNCLALLQSNLRRMLAYSGVAHAGYMLLGIAVGFWDQSAPGGGSAGLGLVAGGVQAAVVYLLAYGVASLGLFAALIYLSQEGKQIDHVEDLTGLSRTHLVPALIAALCLFSFMGIPPLPGFWAKLSVFMGALNSRPDGSSGPHLGFLVVSIVGMLNAAVGAAYYLRIIGVMFLNEPVSTPQPSGGRGAYVTMLASGVAVVILGIAPALLMNTAGNFRLPTTPVRATASEQARPARPDEVPPTGSGPVIARHVDSSPTESRVP
jgi:NADH-quinone oxidoreductase subunit N